MSPAGCIASINRESLVIGVILVVIVLALIALPIFVIAIDHVGSPNLWFDEGGQFFVSLGLNHYSPPQAPYGTWKDVLENNRPFNGDPGGFTVLLRLWMDVFGYSPIAIRSLPFLFFVLAPTVILVSLRRWGAVSPIAAMAGAVLLGYPVIIHYATEVRAYSMEVCAVTFLFFLPCWLEQQTPNWAVALLGGAGALLITSRYSAFVGGIAACVATLIPLRPWRSTIRRAFWFSLPLSVAAAAVYFLATRYQMTGGGRLPAVFEPYLLNGKDAAAKLALLRENLLSPGALPLTFYLLTAPVFAICGPRHLERLRLLVGRTVAFTGVYVAILAIASTTGRLPWAWGARWSLGYQALSACCLAMIIMLFGTCFWQAVQNWRWRLVGVVAVACFIAAWSLQLDSAIKSERPYYETIGSHLQALASSPKAKLLRFFVQYNATPTTRYLVEYGPFKQTFTYPNNFHFETSEEVRAKLPISSRDYDIVVLTHSQFLDSYRARANGASSMTIESPPPSCLIVLNDLFDKPSAGSISFSNTGRNANGSLLSDGALDPHYSYVFSKRFKYVPFLTSSISNATAAVLGRNTGWLGEDGDLSRSRWVSIAGAHPVAYAAPGYYQFRTAFTITGFNLSTFRLTGRWATDNDARGIYVNGRSINFQGSPSYRDWSPLTIGPSGNFQKNNTLDFIVLNTLEQMSPVGLRVELSGTDGGLAPASSSWVGSPATVVVGALAALLVFTGASVPLAFGRAQT